MKNLYLIIAVSFFTLSNAKIVAQGKLIESNDAGVNRMEANRKTVAPFSISFVDNAGYRMSEVNELFKTYLGLRVGVDELKLLNKTSAEGIGIHKYQQYYKGIKVEHGSYIVNSKADLIAFMNGDFFTIDEKISTIPAISVDVARSKAWEYVDGEEPINSDKSENELVFVENLMSPNAIAGKVYLGYKFFIDSRKKSLVHNDIYVDATTGEILFTDSRIKMGCFKDKNFDPLKNEKKNTQFTVVDNANKFNSPFAIAPTAASIYSGTLTNMVTRLSGATYRLEALLGTELYPNHTRNLSHAAVSTATSAQLTTIFTASTEITDADNNWTAAEYNNANKDNTAFDVHWGAQRVYDYWKIRHTRNSWDNANGILNCYVHGDVNWDNAFWTGTPQNSMCYGDGSNVAGGFTTLSSLDVTGHEIGHGVCQATAGLVYSNESGAMNEGFSDIWGASIEHYADPHEADAVAKNYFDIGEEISVGGGALRSMSNPKSHGDPDTYLGTNWYTGTADNGGVHTNSGVLNYWFYLLVTGKNGINDIGNAYSVPGIDWVKAEKIAYLAETNLTTTANYAACRTASINAATTLYGACSLEVEAVTRAWYAVNIGADFMSCTPQIMFNGVVSQTATETGTTGASCLKTKTITIPLKITSAATQAATVNFTIAGTAINGTNADYTISPAMVVFPASSTAIQNVTVTINNDAYVEGAETIILNINSVTTTGNATKGNVFQQYTVDISDDDYQPATAVLSANQTIYSENFTAGAGTWAVANSTGAVNIWRIGNNAGTTTYFTTANNCAYLSQNTTTFSYGTTAGASRLQSPTINTINTSNLQLTFDYVCNGEKNGATFYDYGTLWYSADGGTNWAQINTASYQAVTTKTTVTVALPVGANNVTNLKLGFRWDNDNSVQNQPPFGIDNIVLKGDIRIPASIQTTVNNTTSFDQQYLGPNATVNFYDKVSGNIMGTIENLTSHDYGCTNFEVDRGGSSAQYITGDVSNNAKQKLGDKTFKVTPATNSTTGDYRITLYYSATEKTGYETSSTRVWVADNGSNNGIRVAKHANAISGLTMASTGVLSNIESVGTYGTDYTITARYAGGFSGFAIGVVPAVTLPVTLLNFKGGLQNKSVQLSWSVAAQYNISKYIVEHSIDGTSFTELGIVASSNTIGYNYDYNHQQPSIGDNYYRLKVVNNDGSFKYTSIIKVSLVGKQLLVITPNPITDKFTIQYNSNKKVYGISIVDAYGRMIKEVIVQNNSGSIDIDATHIPSGTYWIKMTLSNNEIVTTKVVK
jgi:Zn-dependent metalloprotease